MARSKEIPDSDCPYCGQAIGQDQVASIAAAESRQRESLEAELRKQYSADLASEVSLRMKEHRDEKTLLVRAREEAERKADSAQQKARDQVTKAREEGRESAAVDLREGDRERAKLEARLTAQAEKTSVQIERAEARIRDGAEADRKLEQRRASLESRASERQVKQLQKTIGELQRQAQNRTADELGDMAEDELHIVLKRAFPTDRIERVPKGRSGADVLQRIVADNEECGLIVYEAKNVRNWSNNFPAKLAKDKVRYKASNAVLVSNVFPSGEDGFCIADEIPVVHPRHVVSIAGLLRDATIEAHRLGASSDETGYKYEQLVGYLQSPDFANRAKQVLRAAEKLLDIQAKERRAHDRVWRQQTEQIGAVESSTSTIRDDIRQILAGR